MEINNRVRKVLTETNFLERFKKISIDYSNMDDTFGKWSRERVEQVFHELGYKAKYHKRENFFEIVQGTNSINSGMNVSLKYGAVEFIPWYKESDGTKLVSGPIGYIRQLLNVDEQINRPCFHNYDELTEILRQGFSIYEDVKLALTEGSQYLQ